MSDINVITKFELLPNEIILECFEYLNAIDIFNSFDFLNSRFYNLIRNISLCLNVGEVENSKIAQFGIKMLLNPEIKKQITSLKFTKNNEFDNIKILFSFVSLNEFSQLRALILSDVDLDMMTINRMSSMLPLLTSLQYFRLENSSVLIRQMLPLLSTSPIKKILIPRIPSTFFLDSPFLSLVNLIISYCSINELCAFLKYSPGLKYFDVKKILQPHNTIFNQSLVSIDQAVSLKRLIINSFSARFDALEILLQRTPNLKVLMISADHCDSHIVNANRWRKLIENSLPLLDVFKFQLSFNIVDEDDGHDVVDKFQQFQTSFWYHEHHWYTEYGLNEYRAFIYTAPYSSTEYEITLNTKRYNNKLINNMNVFTNVTDLKLCIEAMTNTDKYYFPNVKSLILYSDYVNMNDVSAFLIIKHIQCLKTMINMCNLTHLEILSECQLIILQLFNEAPNLSSLTIDLKILMAMLNNRELCECFNKRIKELHVNESSTYPFLEANETLKVFQIFSNMKTFQCYVGSTNDLKIILNQLSKLSYMEAFTYKTFNLSDWKYWLKYDELQLDLYPFTIKCVDLDYVANY